jgi:hypothetical protein
MAGQCELGVTGLATMGANLARTAAGKRVPGRGAQPDRQPDP